MDITLNEGQLMLKSSVREFLEKECADTFVRAMEEDERGYTPEFWNKLADLGWQGYVLPEEHGGIAGDFFDMGILVEEMGYAAMPGPFFSTVVLGSALLEQVGSSEQKNEILPQVTGGQIFLTVAFMEPQGGMTPESIQATAIRQDSGYVITGSKLFVYDAHIADYIICAARTGNSASAEDNITLLMVPKDTAGIRLTPLRTTAGDKQFEVSFEGANVPVAALLGEENRGWPPLDMALQKASALKCAEMVGGMQAALDLTVEYSQRRIVFGRPIASFQAVHHHIADMYKDIVISRLLTYEAMSRLSEGLSASKEVSRAKSHANRASRFVTQMAHQIWGGVGYYTDASLEIYTRRALAGQASFGDTQFHLDRVADQLDFVGR